jgi:hypothetical protein
MLVTDISAAKTLNKLLGMHRARVKNYCELNKATGAKVLLALLDEAIEQSTAAAAELGNELCKLGAAGHADDDESLLKLFAEESITKRNHKALLNACIFECESMRDTYFNSLLEDDPAITTQHHLIFLRHYADLKSWQDKVINLLALFCDRDN